ncbi:MAG: 30S ribosomal protein S6 [Gemmataceae bacterium]
MTNTYECMFLLDTNKVSGDVQAAAKQLHALLEKNKGEVLASRPWDERRLAYPIKGQKKGLFYLTYFRGPSNSLVEIERDIALNEMILRTLILKINPKLVDTMLALARDEHALALHSAHEEEGEGGGEKASGETTEGEEEHRRRPARRKAEV